MLSKDNAAVRETGRPAALRRRGHSDGDGEVAPATPGPSNDVTPRPSGSVLAQVIEEGLLDAFARTLRGPLSQIATIGGTLRHQVDGARAKQVQAIVGAAERAERMIQDLCDFMLVGADLPVARRRMDLILLCERVIDSIQREHPQHAVVLECQPRTRGSRIEGDWDPDRLAGLLTRLIVNAIEHGRDQQVVRVTLHGLPDEVVVEVWNRGPSLSEDLIDRLFEPFVRADGASAFGEHGLGLGLYLARQAARAHGGRLEVRSDPDSGTTFRVMLPRSCQ